MGKIRKEAREAGVRWVADFYDESGQRRKAVFNRKDEAEDFLHRRGQEISHFRRHGERIRKGTNPLFRDFVKRYLEDAPNMKGGVLKPTSLLRARISSKHLIDFMGHKRLAQIGEDDVIRYSKARMDAGGTLPTRSRELTTLKAILHYAVKVGELTRTIEIKLPDPRKFLKQPRYLTRKEYDTLTEKADRDLSALISVAVNTGLRMGELYSLTWAQVDLQAQVLTVTETKSGWPRTLPLNSGTVEVLDRIPRGHGTPYVFSWWHRMRSGPQGVRKRFKTALKNSGIINFRFHDLRHTFASWAAMGGVDLRTLAQWMGHRSLDLVMRYSHVSPAHEREMIERVSGSTGPQPVPGAKKVDHA